MGLGRTRRWAASLGLICVLVAVTGSTSRAHDPPGSRMSPGARAYLSKALSIMEKRALVRHQIDWTSVRTKAYSQAHGAQKPKDTHGAIISALQALGDGHSTFWQPEQVKEELGPSRASLDGLRGRSLKGGVGYVALPRVQGSQESYDQYVRQGRAAVAEADRAGACGWVVDLRANSGGNMWPMLAVVGTLLGEGKVGMFRGADGRTSVWSIKHGAPYQDGEAAGWGDGRARAGGAPPVAVLTGNRTASAGEAIVVAFRGRPDTRFFGEPTGGVPTGNKAHRLSDGAMLILTEVESADRTGRTYNAAIPPDEEISVDPRPVGGRGDGALEAARGWLLRQAACLRS